MRYSFIDEESTNMILDFFKEKKHFNLEYIYNTYYMLAQILTEKKKYLNAIVFYRKSIKINQNIGEIYVNLFELQLIQNQFFEQKLEKKYIEFFKNKKETFIYYKMLKILQDITHNKKVNLEQWKQKYRGVEIDWDFDILDEHHWFIMKSKPVFISIFGALENSTLQFKILFKFNIIY